MLPRSLKARSRARRIDLEAMLTTVKFAIRRLRRSPTFLAVATLSLGIGLGLSTATFASVDAILHPPLVYAEVDRLFYVRLRLGNQRNRPTVGDQVRALRDAPGIAAVELISLGAEGEGVRIAINDVPQRAQAVRMTLGLFATLGVRLRLGRFPHEDEARTQSAVIVSQRFWHDAFRNAPDTRGAVLSIGDQMYSVVGVLPRGADLNYQVDVWVPFASAAEAEQAPDQATTMLVKLRPDVGSAAIKAQLAAVAARFTAVYASPTAPPYVLELQTIRPRNPNIQDFELLILGVAFGVLAIACTNVAALALARGLERRRDHALRIALGGSRLSIGGEVLAEVAVIAVLGTALGVLVSIALNGIYTRIVPEELTWRSLSEPHLSSRVFAYVALACVVSILAAGGFPAWRASRANPAEPLKDNAGTTTGRSRTEFNLLVMGELAVTMVLLMLASLMTLSTKNIEAYDFGYDARRLLRAEVSLWRPKDTLSVAERRRAVQSALARILAHSEIAGVATVGAGAADDGIIISDATGRGVRALNARNYTDVGPGFFATLGIPIVGGRDFVEGDRTSGGAIVLSRTAARVLFPSGRAIGGKVKLGGERSLRGWMTVVGIVRDVELGMRVDPMVDPEPMVFASTPRSLGDSYWQLAIRPARENAELSLRLQHELRDMLPPRSYVRLGPWLATYESRLKYQVFFEHVFSFIGAASLLLGSAGLFSVLSYAVNQRAREFAVRQALGATRYDVVRLVVKSALELALGGMAIGALLSFWASAGVSGLLYGVKNTDPLSLVVAEGALLLVTMLASIAPAMHAMRTDPVEVLRAT
jgi:putative ABC transport system permease protein